jgi:hypothetical protein
MLTITDSTAADIADLGARMAEADRAELAAAGLGFECLEGVQAQALRWHGRLVCLFGAVLQPSGDAVPWMLCTDTLAEVPRRQMALVSRKVVNRWRRRHARLVNYVHRHNATALRFLRWLGFVIDETPSGPGGEFFIFTWERPHV